MATTAALEATQDFIDAKLNRARVLAFAQWVSASRELERRTRSVNGSYESDGGSVVEILKQRWPNAANLLTHDRLTLDGKAAVPPLTTNPGLTGAMAPSSLARAFLQFSRPLSVLGRIPGIHRVPPNTRVLTNTVGASGFAFVGNGLPKPVAQSSWTGVVLPGAVCATIQVISEELLRLASPVAAQTIVNDLAAALASGLDRYFTDPSQAGVPDVAPPSITNGVTAIPSTGDPVADLRALAAAYAADGGSLATAVVLISSQNAVGANLAGASPREFADVTVAGGTLAGIPTVASDALDDQIVIIDAAALALAEGDDVAIAFSRAAALQLDSTPTPVTASSVITSLWQNDLIGVRVEQLVNWLYEGPIARVAGADYLAASAAVSTGRRTR